MDRGALPVVIMVGLLVLLTVVAGPLVTVPIAASWPAWWPVGSGFALIALVAVYVAWQRPSLARVTALRTVIAWTAWAAPALVYALVEGHFGLPPLRLGEQALTASELSHWLDRLTAYSLLGRAPVPDPPAQLGATLALGVVYAAPVLAVLVLGSMWRSARRARGRRG
ncbi:MAG: hypothetical protein ACLFSI_02060 [Halorhodospira sp.]